LLHLTTKFLRFKQTFYLQCFSFFHSKAQTQGRFCKYNKVYPDNFSTQIEKVKSFLKGSYFITEKFCS